MGTIMVRNKELKIKNICFEGPILDRSMEDKISELTEIFPFPVNWVLRFCEL